MSVCRVLSVFWICSCCCYYLPLLHQLMWVLSCQHIRYDYNLLNNEYFLIFCFLRIFVPTIFATSRKKGPRPKWTIYKHISDKSKKSLSVGNFGIPSVICRHLTICLAVARLQHIPAYIKA